VYSPKILAITLYEQFQSKLQAFLVFSFELEENQSNLQHPKSKNQNFQNFF